MLKKSLFPLLFIFFLIACAEKPALRQDGAIQLNTPQANDHDLRETSHSITALHINENSFYLTWASASEAWEHDIYHQIIHIKDGEIISETAPQRYIGAGNDEAQEPVSAAINNEEIILTAWEDGSGETVDIRGQLHYPDGEIIKENWIIAGGDASQHSPSVTNLGKNFLIAYADEAAPAEYTIIKAQILNAESGAHIHSFSFTSPTEDNWWAITASDKENHVFIGWGDGENFSGTIISSENGVFRHTPAQSYISDITQYHYHAIWLDTLKSFLVLAKSNDKSTACIVNLAGEKVTCTNALPPIIREANLAIQENTIAYATGENEIALLEIGNPGIIHIKTLSTNTTWNTTGAWTEFTDNMLFVATNSTNSNRANYLIVGEMP